MGKSINPEIIEGAIASLINTLEQATPSFSVAPLRYNPVLRNADGVVLWCNDEEFPTAEAALRRAEEVRAAGFTEGNAS